MSEQNNAAPDPSAIADLPITAVMAENIVRLSPDASLTAIAKALTEGEVGMVVLATGEGDIQRNDVAAVVSERDLARAIANGLPLDSTPGTAVASTRLVWCEVDNVASDVAFEMLEHYVRHVLVDDNGRLAGVVSMRDVLGVYVAQDHV